MQTLVVSVVVVLLIVIIIVGQTAGRSIPVVVVGQSIAAGHTTDGEGREDRRYVVEGASDVVGTAVVGGLEEYVGTGVGRPVGN